MPSGTRGRGNPDYSSTEYAQPWGGVDLSKPSSQIPPGSTVSQNATIIRGALSNSPAIVAVTSATVPVTSPNFAVGELPLAITNVSGITIIITNVGVWSDVTSPAYTSKAFHTIYTFPTPYPSNGSHVGTIVIGGWLYFSSSMARGVYATKGTTVVEVSAHNGSQPFIGGDFLFTVANRLCLGNIIGGDGNQTGSVTGATVTTGGTGYPASGSVLFTGGGGQSATGTFTATGGIITAITITNGGSGFLSAPTPSIVGTTGTGFTGTATISGFTSNSTNTNYPDYVAWSFPFAAGALSPSIFFDPNSTLLGGGFSEINEARGLITGVAVFEAVGMIAHNGGFTEMVPNTSSSIGSNIEPFTFAPLWSADQGVVCRYGSMAQYGAMCCFLGYDQPYQLSPGGLTPFGSKIASLVQNYSLWNDAQVFAGGYFGINPGIYGSIVQIEGEKHYLLVFSEQNGDVANRTTRRTQVFDCLIRDDAWSVWDLGASITVTAPIYQSEDVQLYNGSPGPLNVSRDDWILVTFIQGGVSFTSTLGRLAVGNALYQNAATVLQSTSTSVLFRTEAPLMNITQTRRRVMIEYENLPSQVNNPATISVEIYGQPLPTGYPPSPTSQSQPSQSFNITLQYFAAPSSSTPSNAVLTAFSDPIGTAFTGLALAISLGANFLNYFRIIRIGMIDETTQSEQQ